VPTEHPKDLLALVRYQNGAIVSKTLIKQNTGSVTLFAFDQGQDSSGHSTSFEALAYVVDGAAEITVAGNRYSVKQGEMLILPANTPPRGTS